MSSLSLFDTVRIRTTDETEGLGIAGRTGLFYGFTTPSVTGVRIVGRGAGDLAFSVSIEGQDEPLYLDPDLVEFVDHTPGVTASVGGRNFTRRADGEWIENDSESERQ
jgi:hypothetical protein